MTKEKEKTRKVLRAYVNRSFLLPSRKELDESCRLIGLPVTKNLDNESDKYKLYFGARLELFKLKEAHKICAEQMAWLAGIGDKPVNQNEVRAVSIMTAARLMSRVQTALDEASLGREGVFDALGLRQDAMTGLVQEEFFASSNFPIISKIAILAENYRDLVLNYSSDKKEKLLKICKAFEMPVSVFRQCESVCATNQKSPKL